MLSNPTTNLHQRQRQHRRQQSTPTAYDNQKVQNLPKIQRNASHRRGISLDQRQRRQSPPQDHTNQGFQQTQQHILREAQQQRLARPGQTNHGLYLNLTNDENYLTSPIVSPQIQDFDTGCQNGYGAARPQARPYSPYSGQFNSTMRINPHDYSGSMSYGNQDALLFSDGGNLTPSAFLDFSMPFEGGSGQEDWGATIRPSNRPSSRRISGGIAGRVAKFEDLTVEQQASRPITPPNQHASNYFPPTPAHTPYNRVPKVEQMPQRFADSYDTSMEATIKPGRKTPRGKDAFQEMRDFVEMNHPPSPPNTGPMPSISTFDSARMPTSNFVSTSEASMEFNKQDEYDSSYYSPTISHRSQPSQHSSPNISQTASFAHFDKPGLDTPEGSYYLPSSESINDLAQQMSSMQSSPVHRSASLDSLDIDETITETGITIDDIACYIDGPDLVDQKWQCLFPECGKRFGRKENIKSHVQTHLGDRQFQCPHCKKCFVRQHDLKRHAKIHSGVKPYPCACGNSFARHDALTRHRQRGMCIGAFEGVVKKVVKRGRPRKNRPDDEERLDKASRTRSKNVGKAMSSSSASAYSESSYGLSPEGDLDMLDERPFDYLNADFTQSSAIMDNNLAYSPVPSMPADYMSPQAFQNAASPSAFSTHSHQSHYSGHRGSIASIPSHHLPSHPPSPAKSVAEIPQSRSQYNTPLPELVQSSSPPAASTRLYDIPEPGHELDLSALGMQTEDDLFLDAFGNSSSMDLGPRLEQDAGLMLMGGKFDDAFAIVDNNEMFVNDDVFFGSP